MESALGSLYYPSNSTPLPCPSLYPYLLPSPMPPALSLPRSPLPLPSLQTEEWSTPLPSETERETQPRESADAPEFGRPIGMDGDAGVRQPPTRHRSPVLAHCPLPPSPEGGGGGAEGPRSRLFLSHTTSPERERRTTQGGSHDTRAAGRIPVRKLWDFRRIR